LLQRIVLALLSDNCGAYFDAVRALDVAAVQLLEPQTGSRHRLQQQRPDVCRMPPAKPALRLQREVASIRSGCHKLERRQHYVWT
jgi:hypothetical protein